MAQYVRCRKAINRFIRKGRVGHLGHVSCIDRRSGQAGTDALTRHTADQLSEICQLLACNPVSVMAQSSQRDGMEVMQAFLTTDAGTGVHYFGTLGDDCDEHDLWLEGANGSMRTDGNRVSFRNRGWPVFIPVRFGLFGGGRSTNANAAGNEELRGAIQRSADQRSPCAIAASRAGA